LDLNGAAYCWGDHNAGKLGGDQRTGPVFSPEPVSGDLTFVSLTADQAKTCGATDDGRLYCWGILANSAAALSGLERCEIPTAKGDPRYVGCSYVPLRIPLTGDFDGHPLFVEVSGPCARTASGSVFCQHESLAAYTPESGLGDLTAISANTDHGCGLTASGSALCWGSNGTGQLGNGTSTSSQAPVSVSGGHSFTQISVGNQHSCGLTMDQEVWCWGSSHHGQAGRSILTPALTPEKTRGQG
jgi:alpha-tubulin suppressor-like RCC1 family protein